MTLIELSAGPVAYEDTGGDGPTVVLLHGLMMDSSLWAEPVAELAAGARQAARRTPAAREPGGDRRQPHARRAGPAT